MSERFLLLLRLEVAGRKWIIWVALLFVLVIAFEIGLALLPHQIQNTLLQYEEKPNGVREFFPNGVRDLPR